MEPISNITGLSYEQQVLMRLTELKAGQAQMNEHLTQLNSKVATHEKSIGELLLAEVKRASSDEASAKVNEVWLARFKPLVPFVIVIAIGAVLTSGPQIWKLFRP